MYLSFLLISASTTESATHQSPLITPHIVRDDMMKTFRSALENSLSKEEYPLNPFTKEAQMLSASILENLEKEKRKLMVEDITEESSQIDSPSKVNAIAEATRNKDLVWLNYLIGLWKDAPTSLVIHEAKASYSRLLEMRQAIVKTEEVKFPEEFIMFLKDEIIKRFRKGLDIADENMRKKDEGGNGSPIFSNEHSINFKLLIISKQIQLEDLISEIATQMELPVAYVHAVVLKENKDAPFIMNYSNLKFYN